MTSKNKSVLIRYEAEVQNKLMAIIGNQYLRIGSCCKKITRGIPVNGLPTPVGYKIVTTDNCYAPMTTNRQIFKPANKALKIH